MIRNVTTNDAAAICEIYNHHVLNTTVTFEEEPVSIATMQQRISEVSVNHPWIVYLLNDTLVAYAYATLWKTRSAYRYSVESTIYVTKDLSGQGIGKKLYAALMDTLSDGGIHAVIGGIALPNDASVKLHESLGFYKIGHFKEVGRKFGSWVDVGYWELIF